MASVKNEHIERDPLKVLDVDLKANPQQRLQDPNELRLIRYHHSLTGLVGQEPTYSLLFTSHATTRNRFFVNACVYISSHDEIYLTSSLLPSASSAQPPQVLISKVNLTRDAQSGIVEAAQWQKLRSPPSMPNPAGACPYESGVVYTSQGTLDAGGGLVYMPRNKAPIQLVMRYGGKPFTSLQRVAVSPHDGSIWFTDSDVGLEAGIREEGELPNLVYRFGASDGVIRVMEDGLGRPGAIAFAPREDTLYISEVDAGRKSEEGSKRAATIYAYDILTRHGQSFLANKRVFAVTFQGVAADLECDVDGNVYAACGDGVEIWTPGGVPCGLIEIAGGCSSLCFGERRELFVGAGQRLWMVQFSVPVPST